jgi:hypothetical protein
MFILDQLDAATSIIQMICASVIRGQTQMPQHLFRCYMQFAYGEGWESPAICLWYVAAARVEKQYVPYEGPFDHAGSSILRAEPPRKFTGCPVYILQVEAFDDLTPTKKIARWDEDKKKWRSLIR